MLWQWRRVSKKNVSMGIGKKQRVSESGANLYSMKTKALWPCFGSVSEDINCMDKTQVLRKLHKSFPWRKRGQSHLLPAFLQGNSVISNFCATHWSLEFWQNEYKKITKRKPERQLTGKIFWQLSRALVFVLLPPQEGFYTVVFPRSWGNPNIIHISFPVRNGSSETLHTKALAKILKALSTGLQRRKMHTHLTGRKSTKGIYYKK